MSSFVEDLPRVTRSSSALAHYLYPPSPPKRTFLQLLGRHILSSTIIIYTFESGQVEAAMTEIVSQGRLEPKVPDIQGSGSETNAEPDAEEERFILSRHAILIFLTLAVLTLMAALDGTSISVALPIIAQRLHGTAIEAFWSGTSFLLCSTVFQPSFASLSHIFGRRPLILVAILFFFTGTTLAGVSQNFTQMLVGRSLQGVGGGGITALTNVIVTDLVPLRERGKYFGILNAMWSLGSVMGPILGGGFAQNVTWRWVFYINFPFIGIGTILVILFLRLRPVPTTFIEKLRQIDYAGIILFTGSLSSFLIPLTWGGVSYDWDSWHTLVPLLIGVIGLVLFVLYEHYVTKVPVIPTSLFSNRTANITFLETVLQGLVLWCQLYYLPLYYEAVKGYSPIITGVALFPGTFTVAPFAILTGALVTYTGHYRWAIWLGWTLSTLGNGLLCYIKPSTTVPAWVFLTMVSGMGLGFLFPSLAYSVQASMDDDNLAMASALFSFFRTLGQAIGVAIGGVVFQNLMHKNLLKYAALASKADAYSQDAAELVQVIKYMPDDEVKANVQVAYTDSLRIVWAMCCGICGFGLFLSLWTKGYSVNRLLRTPQGLEARPVAEDDKQNVHS
ncbi:major facilitator superfamily domain-containing protein [Aspergillus flavus]|uniref:Major facilitator superfamily domain-containing protein n=1 Tax=Aspergillus flavus TaxID=5059 RepID=A0A5N6H1W9_ASPFL|nr:major facilitator superfamily domain-containing protein [Aspergillus flavus]